MRALLGLILLLAPIKTVFAKHFISGMASCYSPHENYKAVHKTFAWYSPVFRSMTIDGVAIGIEAAPFRHGDSLVVNGLNVEVDPFVPATVAWCTFYFPIYLHTIVKRSNEYYKKEKAFANDRNTSRPRRKVYKDSICPPSTKINGVSLSTGVVNAKLLLRGFALNASCAIQNEMYGVEITGVVNKHERCKGVVVAPLNIINRGKGVQMGLVDHCIQGKVVQVGVVNISKKAHGTQIGLINNSADDNVVQIGLINTLGGGTTPLINFKRRHRKNWDVDRINEKAHVTSSSKLVDWLHSCYCGPNGGQ